MTPRALRGIAFSLALFATLFILALSVIIPSRGNQFDFYPRYAGTQAFWRGESPYSDAVTAQIQIGMFGEILPADEDQQRFAYPAYTAVLLTPFAGFPSDLATAAWMALQIIALAFALWLWFNILDWRLPPLRRILLIALLLIVYRYPLTLYLIGQFTGVIILCITLGVYFLLRERDIVAGVCFALATIQPTISAPLAGVILVAYALRGRWRGLATFVATIVILTLITIIRIGWWMPDFLDNLDDYASYAKYYIWPPELIESPVVRIAFVVVVVIIAGWATWRFISLPSSENVGEGLTNRRFAPSPTSTINSLFVLIPACLILLPQTGSYYLMLLLPLLLASLQNTMRLRGAAKAVALLACMSVLLIPWVYLVMPEEARQVESLLLPIHAWLVWAGTTWLAGHNTEDVLPVGASHDSILHQDVHA